MPVFHNLKLIFIHVPKNAGTCLTDFFTLANGGPPEAEGHHSWQWYSQNYPAEWASYFKIAVIREPFDRFFSCYHYARMLKSHWHSPDGSTAWGVHQDYPLLKDASLAEACDRLQKGQLQHPTWASQSAYCFHQGKPVVDMLLRYEKLNNDLGVVCQQLCIPYSGQLQMVNKTIRPAEDQLPMEAVEVLKSVYKDDFDLLGYAFTVVSS